MAKIYLERLTALLAPTLAALPAHITLEIKHFFSGAAVFADGRICISLTSVGLAMKLPEDDRARLMQDGGKPLQYFPKAPIKKQYVVLAEELADQWSRRSIDYALTLPAPKRKKKKG